MDALTTIQKAALDHLCNHRDKLTSQQIKTLKGQVLAGDPEGAMRGLQRILERRWLRDNTT